MGKKIIRLASLKGMKKIYKYLLPLLLLTACGPSCEEQGVQIESRGIILMPMFIGKVMYMMPIEQWQCVIPPQSG